MIGGEGGIGKTRLALELVGRARAGNARAARCTAADLGGAPPFAPWVELLAGLARELEPPPADAQLAGGARAPGAVAAAAARAPAGRARRGAARPRPRAAVRGGGRARRARDGRPAAGAAASTTSTSPTRRRSSWPPTSRGGSSTCRCCSCSRGAWSRAATRSTRSSTPRAAAASPCASSRSSRSTAASSRRWSARSPRSPRRSASASSRPPTATRCSRSRARAPPRAATQDRPRRCAAPCARRSPGSTSRARRAAELAAVAGRPLDRVELSALAPPEAVLAAMDCGLFRSADGRFGFRHDLLREAALADLDDARRVLLHEMLGSAPGVRAAEAAHHLRLAGRDDLAVGRLVEAAADATQATAHRRGGGLPRGGRRAAPGRPARAAASWPTTLAQLGRREDALAALEAAVRLIDPADAAARVHAHLRAAVWCRSSLCDPTRAGRSAQLGLDALDGGRSDDLETRAELLLIRAWGEVTTLGAGAADAHAGRARRARARPRDLAAAAPPPRQRARLHRCSRKGGSPRPRRCWSPPARPASAPAGPTSPTAAGPTRACIAVRRRGTRAGAGARRARRAQVQRRCRPSSSRWPACSPTRSRGSGAIAEARAANDRQAELAARLASPELRVGRGPRRRAARAAGGRPRARGGAARPRARGRPAGAAGRGAAAARRGARAARPRRRGRRRDPRRHARAGPRRPPPGRAGRPDDVRPGAQRARARRPRARRAAAARGRGPLAPARRRRRRRARAPGLARRPRAARRSPASSTRRASSSASPRSCEHWRPMPTFDDSATSEAPVEEVWKLLYDPARLVEWWEGIETRRAERRRRDHDLPGAAIRTSRCRRRCAPPPTAAA